jgi:hypothetical protein
MNDVACTVMAGLELADSHQHLTPTAPLHKTLTDSAVITALAVPQEAEAMMEWYLHVELVEDEVPVEAAQ